MDWALRKYPMYYGGVKQVHPNIKPGMPFFSKSAAAGNLLFLSGSAGRTLETGDVPSGIFEEQMLVALNKIKLALEEAGSSLDNLVKTFILLSDQRNYHRLWKTLLEYYQEQASLLVEEPPVSTVIQVASLAKSHYLIEIEAVAVVKKDEPGWEVKKYPLYCGGVKQVYPNIKPGMPFLSESVAVGNLLFVSGMTGEMPESGKVPSDVLEEQIAVAHSKVRTAMEKAGSSLSNVIKTFHFLTRMDLPSIEVKDQQAGYSPATARMWKAELEYFEKHAPFLLDEPPASTCMQVPFIGNSDPACLVGMDVIGVISRDRPGWEMKKNLLYYGNRGFPRHLGDIKMYYANSVSVGNLVFFSGEAPKSPYNNRVETDAFEEQMYLVLDKLRLSMEGAGTSMNNLIKTVMMLKNLEDYPRMRRIELEYYQKYAPLLIDEPPASTFILPRSLATPKFLIEIDAIGVIPRSTHKETPTY